MLCGFKHRQVYLASALYDCLEDENLHDIEVLLKFNGADPSVIIPEKGISPFHYAIGIDSTEFAFEVTNLFLRHGSNPNTRSSEEDLTPLHVAAAWGRLDILRLLLANGADPSLKDEDGCTALDLAVEEGHWNVVQEIKTHEMTSTHHGDGVISLTLDKVIISDGEVEAEYELLKNTESPIITKLKNDFKNTEKRDSVEEWREKYVTNKTNKYPETDSTCGGAYDDLTDYKIRRDKIKKRREKSFIEKWTNAYYCGSKKTDDNIKLPRSEGFEQQNIDMAHLEPVEYLNISSKFGKQNEQSISNSKQYGVQKHNKSIIINNEKNDIIGNRIEVTEKTNTAPSNIEDCFKKPYDVVKPIGLCRKTDKTTANTHLSLDSSVLESVKLDNDLKTPEKDLKSYDYLSESAWSDSMSFQTPKSVGSISGIKELKFTQIYPSDLNSDDFLSCTDDVILVTDTSNYTNCDPEVIHNTIETKTATSTHPKVKLQNCQINKVEENTAPAMSHHIKTTADIIQNNNYVYKSPIRSLINDFVTGENIKKNTTIDRHFSLVSADFSLVTSDCSIDNVLNEQIYFNNTFTIDSVSTTESLVEEEEKIAPSKVIKSAIDLIAPSKVIKSAIDLIAPSKVIKSTIDLIASENEISKIPMATFNVIDNKKRRSKSESNLTDKILEESKTVASTKSPNIMLKRSEMAAIDAKPDLILSGNRTLDVEPVFPTNKIKTIKMNKFKSIPNLAKGNMVTVPKTTLLGKKAPVLKTNITKESVELNKPKSKSENAFISKYKNLNPKTKTDIENKAVNVLPKCGTFTAKFPKFPKSRLPNIVQEVENKNALQIKKQIPNFPKQGDDCKNVVSSHSDRQSFFVGVSEEYRYTDEEEGVELIERRLPVSPLPSFVSTTPASSSGSDISLPKVVDYDTDTLIRELTAFGLTPGPVTKTTKKIYLKRIIKYKKKPPVLIDVGKTRPAYSVELEKTLRNPSWHLDLAHYVALEQTVSNQFASVDPKKRWREGLAKSSFTYLLLDPRVTENLPGRADVLTDDEKWKTFISAIFYVGKGKRSRPYSHLYQAVGVWNKGIAITTDKKVQHILEIWNSQHGVVCLHVFQNVIPVEAFTREAAMIDVLTLKNLKNNKLGDYYGIAATWPQKQKRQLGVYLLYRAMLILMNEGERQLRPVDIG